MSQLPLVNIDSNVCFRCAVALDNETTGKVLITFTVGVSNGFKVSKRMWTCKACANVFERNGGKIELQAKAIRADEPNTQ